MLGKFKQATKGIPSPFVKNYPNSPGLGTLQSGPLFLVSMKRIYNKSRLKFSVVGEPHLVDNDRLNAMNGIDK